MILDLIGTTVKTTKVAYAADEHTADFYASPDINEVDPLFIGSDLDRKGVSTSGCLNSNTPADPRSIAAYLWVNNALRLGKKTALPIPAVTTV